MKRRKYQQTRRAEQQVQTRARIVEALIELHGEIGPAKTTISAIAQRAGVERQTVYRYFPDTASQLQACSSRYFESNPPPSTEQWLGEAEPTRRIAKMLKNYYAYYRQTAPIFHHAYRDAEEMVEVAAALAPFEDHLESGVRVSLEGVAMASDCLQATTCTLRFGLRFSTWESLEKMDVSDEEKVGLVGSWIVGTVDPERHCA